MDNPTIERRNETSGNTGLIPQETRHGGDAELFNILFRHLSNANDLESQQRGDGGEDYSNATVRRYSNAICALFHHVGCLPKMLKKYCCRGCAQQPIIRKVPCDLVFERIDVVVDNRVRLSVEPMMISNTIVAMSTTPPINKRYSRAPCPFDPFFPSSSLVCLINHSIRLVLQIH